MPLVVPQLKTITLGGAVTGLGIESTSLRNGMPHESVIEMEILTGDGRVVTRHRGQRARRRCSAASPTPTARSATPCRSPSSSSRCSRSCTCATSASAAPEACMDAIATDRGRRQLRRSPGRLRGRHRVQPDELYLTVGAFSEVAPWRSDYTGQQIYYQSIRRTEGGLPDHPRLPVALGHRLVLVLAGIRRAESRHPHGSGRAGTAAPMSTASLSHSTAGTACPRDQRAAGRRCPRERHPGRGDPGRAWRRVPQVLRRAGRDEPGLDVPASVARRRRPGRFTRCSPDEVYVNFGFWGTVAAARRSCRRLLQPAIEDKVSALGGHKCLYSTSFYAEDDFWARYNGPAVRQAQARLRRRKTAARPVRQVCGGSDGRQ